MANAIPFVSQAKSLFQLVCLDPKGALETQKDFMQECPGFSQATSLGQLCVGDKRGALNTQKKCLRNIERTVDSTPILGHGKGLVHYVCGDVKGGNQAMMKSTKTIAVMGGGVAGFAVGGPAGAYAAGVGSGLAYDSALTIVDSELEGEYSPKGVYVPIKKFAKNRKPGDLFDVGYAAVAAGKKGVKGGRNNASWEN